MAACANCASTFEKKNRHYNRFSLENIVPTSGEAARDVLENLTGAAFTPVSSKRQGQYLCANCWANLKDNVRYTSAVNDFWVKTGDTYIGKKRESGGAPSADISAKKPRFTSTPKRNVPAKKSLFLSKAKRSTKWDSIVSAVRNRKYATAIRKLFEATKGSRNKFLGVVAQIIRREVSNVLDSKTTFPLCDDVTIPNIAEFSWDNTLSILQEHAPLLYTALQSVVTSKRNQDTMKRGASVNLKPRLGAAVACLLHAKSPQRASFFPTLLSIQFWRGGLKRETIKQLSHTGICLGYNATLSAVDRIRSDFDAAAKTCKHLLEEELQTTEPRQQSIDERDLDLSLALSETVPNIEDEVNCPSDIEIEDETVLYSDDDCIDDEDDENVDDAETETDEYEETGDQHQTNISSEIVSEEMETDDTIECAKDSNEIRHPGFTMCWDNVGNKVTTRHPTTETKNIYLNMALGYMAINRIASSHMQSGSTGLIQAVDLPTETFIPTYKDFEGLQQRMETIVGRILTHHFNWFKTHFQECTTSHILHEHSSESSRKSVMINLGVFDENPSTTQGAIGIYERLQKYVPSINSEPYTTLVYGDGMSCERGNDAHRARVNGLNPWERLEGLEPAAQEFHKEMILLQDFYDEFFKGASAADRGTLCQLKNLFNFRNAKADVSDNFSQAWELMCLVTEGFVCLLVMKMLDMPDTSMRPDSAIASIEESSHDDKCEYFKSICKSVVKKVWHEFDTKSLKIADDSGPPMYCCGDEKDDFLICCEERARCTKGEVFHCSCVGLDPEHLPESWYCSDECRNRKYFYRFCHCHEDLGDTVPMIGCAAEANCSGYEWYHYKCVGMTTETLPKGDWFCQATCQSAVGKYRKKSSKTSSKPTDSTDYVYGYSRSITWCGLNLLCRRDAVREADGEAIMSNWKIDLVHFFKRKHQKYLILAHRLIASINGWVSEKMKHDLIWNRTVNYGGGIGINLPMDLMNEILNRLFKDLLGASKGRYTDNTVQRCSQIVGPLGESLDAVFDSKVIEN